MGLHYICTSIGLFLPLACCFDLAGLGLQSSRRRIPAALGSIYIFHLPRVVSMIFYPPEVHSVSETCVIHKQADIW
jgi:hypothetical protein